MLCTMTWTKYSLEFVLLMETDLADGRTSISGFLNRLSKQGINNGDDERRVQNMSAVLPCSEAHGDHKEEFVIIGLGRFGASGRYSGIL